MNELLSDIRHPSAGAVGLRVTKNPPCQARGWTGCSPRRRGKLPVIGHPTPQEGRHLASVALSILMFCSTTNLRIRKASDQPESCAGELEQKKNLWISSRTPGTRPERSIPAIPVAAKPAKPPQRRPISPKLTKRWRRSADCRQEPALGMRCEGCGNACRVARHPLKVQ